MFSGLDSKANAHIPPRWIDDTNDTSRKDHGNNGPLFIKKSEEHIFYFLACLKFLKTCAASIS